MFEKKLKVVKGCINTCNSLGYFTKFINSLPGDELLTYYRGRPDTHAMPFLLLPKVCLEAFSFMDLLIAHLIGPDNERYAQVCRQINATVSDDFKNTLLHDFVINEAWINVMHLLASCRSRDIRLHAVLREDANGRTPLDLAFMMDVAPDEVLKALIELSLTEMLTQVDSRLLLSDDVVRQTAFVHQHFSRLLQSLVILFRNKRQAILDWLSLTHPGLYDALVQCIANQGICVLTESEYLSQLRDVCIYGLRSSGAPCNKLRLDLCDDSGQVLDQVTVYRDDIGVCFVSYKKDIYTIELHDPENYPFDIVNVQQLPWDPVLQEVSLRSLCYSKKNIFILWRFLTQIMLKVDTKSRSCLLQLVDALHRIVKSWSADACAQFMMKAASPCSNNPDQIDMESLVDAFNNRSSAILQCVQVNESSHGLSAHTLFGQLDCKIGSRVEIFGLKAAVHNGKFGTIIGNGHAKGRVRVKLDDGLIIQPMYDKCRALADLDASYKTCATLDA